MRLVILIGQRVRSGTNFLGSTLSQHPHIQTIPKESSHGEFNLFRSDSIENFYHEASSKSFGINFNDADRLHFYKRIGELWLELLSKKFDLDENKTLFLKTPIISHYELWLKAFPEAKFIFLCRDGRDNVISSVKASNLRKRSTPYKAKVIKSLNHYSGRAFRAHILDWKATASIFESIEEQKNIKKVKYEDLVDSSENIKRLLQFLEMDSSEEIIKRCINAPVVGSSFGKNTKGKGSNWIPEKDKSNFKFVNKWSKWGAFKRKYFKLLAGKELIKLGYEKDTNW